MKERKRITKWLAQVATSIENLNLNEVNLYPSRKRLFHGNPKDPDFKYTPGNHTNTVNHRRRLKRAYQRDSIDGVVSYIKRIQNHLLGAVKKDTEKYSPIITQFDNTTLSLINNR